MFIAKTIFTVWIHIFHRNQHGRTDRLMRITTYNSIIINASNLAVISADTSNVYFINNGFNLTRPSFCTLCLLYLLIARQRLTAR